MQLTQATGRDLIERWVLIHRGLGKTNDEMKETMFVYGNEILTLHFNEQGALEIEAEKKHVVVFRKMDELDMTNTCRACSMEHLSYKDAIECCVDIEE